MSFSRRESGDIFLSLRAFAHQCDVHSVQKKKVSFFGWIWRKTHQPSVCFSIRINVMCATNQIYNWEINGHLFMFQTVEICFILRRKVANYNCLRWSFDNVMNKRIWFAQVFLCKHLSLPFSLSLNWINKITFILSLPVQFNSICMLLSLSAQLFINAIAFCHIMKYFYLIILFCKKKTKRGGGNECKRKVAWNDMMLSVRLCLWSTDKKWCIIISYSVVSIVCMLSLLSLH